MTPPSPPPLDTRVLLEHAQWMRRLARSLVGDAERAEDLSQETWRRLLERPPALDLPFRGWIATVMRNLVRAERRDAARRSAREEDSARDEAEPSSLELLERATLQHELVQAVLELEEPYRTTILLRYFEERSPAEIAARERLPLATVKTRLARGIARLRERLARTLGPDGRVSALVALARVASPPAASPWLPWTAVSLAMNAKILVPLGVMLAACLAWFLIPREERSETTPSPAVAAVLPAPTAEPGPAPMPLEPPEARREVTVPATPTHSAVRGAPAPASRDETHVRGRVIDLHGAAVAGVEIAFAPLAAPAPSLAAHEASTTRALATAGPDGGFEFAGEHQGHLFVRSELWTTVLAGVPVEDRTGQECRIVVAPSLVLAGIVLDEFGLPLADAHLVLEPPGDLRARLSDVLDFSAPVAWNTLSEDSGRFRIADVPALPGGVLRIELEGYLALEEPAPERMTTDLVLVLRRPGSEHRQLSGRVVDAADAPVPEAFVSLGIDTTRTDEAGRFRFELDDPDSFGRRAAGFLRVPDDLLRALAPGHLPAELRARERDDAGAPLWPSPLVLRLGGDPATIAGTVVDERGNPLAGERVWIADPTLFGGLVEGSDRERFPRFVHVESLLARQDPGWNWVESDAQGRFELTGLSEREYSLAAMDPGTLLRTVEPLVHAGRRDVLLVLRMGEVFPRLAGRLLDSRGKPVPGAGVFPMCDALVTQLEGQVLGTQHETTPGTTSDANGRFALERVPKDLVYLRIQGADVIPLEWGRGLEGGLARLVGDDSEELEIQVERRCHFQVELAVPAEADELGVLDDDGNELTISLFVGNGRQDTERHPLVDGRSSTLAVGDRAATLVLYRGGSEVRRVPLHLEAGTTANLRL